MSFDEYVQFIVEPKLLINPVRDVILFDSPYLEVFSKTSWYTIPIGWSPFLIYYFYLNELDVISTIFYFLLGAMNWTLLEYLIHRFVFHGEDVWLPENNTAYVAHFLLHGIHHAFP
jgi:4-hydroxysphinganine ceramide fatty acyl 2-hydroxylase